MRIVGKQAALYLDLSGTWTYVADLFDYQIDYEMVLLDGSIKGDTSERKVVSHGRGRLSAKRYVETGGTFALADLITAGNRLDWAAVTVDTLVPSPGGFSSNTSAKVQGTGYVARTQTHVPQGMVEDAFELELDTLPVFA